MSGRNKIMINSHSFILSLCKCLLTIIVIFSFSYPLTAQVNPSDLEIHMGHPRIMLLEGEENMILDLLKKDSKLDKIHNSILKECDLMLKMPVLERIVKGKRLLEVSREALRRIFFLSYAYRLTSNDDYLNRAEQELLAISNFADWNPDHFLDVGEMTMAAAIGYDWLFAELSPTTRSAIKEAIVKKGLEPSLKKEYNSWLYVSNNWNQVCNAGMSFGAMAVYDDYPDLAKEIIGRSINTIGRSMEEYGPEGSYPEGYIYWGYGTTFNVLLLSALEKIYGHDFKLSQHPGFIESARYLMHMTGPTGVFFNYSDAAPEGRFNPGMYWFAQKTQDESLLYVENQLLEAGVLDPTIRFLPGILIWSIGLDLTKVAQPQELVWSGNGVNPVALMRTSWTDDEAVFVGIKGGSPSVSHAHMDVGSFVMEADGVRWAKDFGLQDYYLLESAGLNIWDHGQASDRWKVLVYTNHVHNTLTINEELQQVDGYSKKIVSSDSPDFTFAKLDITDVYRKNIRKAERGIAIIDKKYVVVRDEITSGTSAAQVRWSMLTDAEVRMLGNDCAELTIGDKNLILYVKSKHPFKLISNPVEPVYDHDAPAPGMKIIGYTSELPSGKNSSFEVYLIPGSAKDVKLSKTRNLSRWKAKN